MTDKPELPSIQEIFDFAKATAKKVFEKDGEHYPLFMLAANGNLGQGPGLGLCPMSWSDDAEKRAQLESFKQAFRDLNGVFYIGIVETWMARMSPEEYARDSRRPSEREDRVEAILIFGEHADGTALAGNYPINRDANGKPSLGEFQTWETPQKEAMMLDPMMMRGIFPERRTH